MEKFLLENKWLGEVWQVRNLTVRRDLPAYLMLVGGVQALFYESNETF